MSHSDSGALSCSGSWARAESRRETLLQLHQGGEEALLLWCGRSSSFSQVLEVHQVLAFGGLAGAVVSLL